MSIPLECSECKTVARYASNEIFQKKTVVHRGLPGNVAGNLVICCKSCGQKFKVDKKQILMRLEGSDR